MSREERQKASSSAQRDFWWLSDRSYADSSTPKEDSPGAKRSRRFTPHSPISPYKGHDKGCGYKKPELKVNIWKLQPFKKLYYFTCKHWVCA